MDLVCAVRVLACHCASINTGCDWFYKSARFNSCCHGEGEGSHAVFKQASCVHHFKARVSMSLLACRLPQLLLCKPNSSCATVHSANIITCIVFVREWSPGTAQGHFTQLLFGSWLCVSLLRTSVCVCGRALDVRGFALWPTSLASVD